MGAEDHIVGATGNGRLKGQSRNDLGSILNVTLPCGRRPVGPGPARAQITRRGRTTRTQLDEPQLPERPQIGRAHV